MRLSKMSVVKVVVIATLSICLFNLNMPPLLISNHIVRAATTLTVNPPGLPPDYLNNAYPSQTLVASGGVAPYIFQISGGYLPYGLSLTSAGVLSGTPTQVGTYSFTVTAFDSESSPGLGSRSCSITITALITVNSTADVAYGGCRPSIPICTLRDALASANSGGVTINFALSGNSNCPQADSAYSNCIELNTPLHITSNAATGGVSIVAPNPNYVLISGGGEKQIPNLSQVFINEAGFALSLYNITAGYGSTGNNNIIDEDGGVIANYGTMTIDNSVIEGGIAQSASAQPFDGYQPGEGGGIFNSGSMTIQDGSQLNNNTANGSTGFPSNPSLGFEGQRGLGGAVFKIGTLVVSDSQFNSNNAVFDHSSDSFPATGGAIAGQGGSIAISKQHVQLQSIF